MKSEFQIFVEHWHEISLIWSKIFLGAAFLVFLYYQLMILIKRKQNKRHEFISKSEIKFYWLTALALTVSFTFFLNSILVRAHATDTEFQLSLKIIVTVGLGFLIGYFINTYLHVYYPFNLANKLQKLRFQKRISPVSGKEMRLLTEKEEDVHLTKDMIENETISAFEYDVWVDDSSDFRLIETYKGNLSLVICEKCSYRTSHEYEEKMEIEPTETEEGLLRKYYKCAYCDHKQIRSSKIAPLPKLV